MTRLVCGTAARDREYLEFGFDRRGGRDAGVVRICDLLASAVPGEADREYPVKADAGRE